MHNTHTTQQKEKGFAAIITVIAVISLGLIFTSGFLSVTAQNAKAIKEQLNSIQSYYASESGIEDAIYRIKYGKNIGTQTILNVGTASATTTISTDGENKTILAEGAFSNNIRRTQVSLSINATQADFFYGVQVGEGGISMDNNSTINGSVYSDGSITGSGDITGDVIVAGGLSGTPTLSWADNNSDQFFATIAGNQDIAQSFTATAGGALNRVSVYLAKVGSPTSNLTLRLAADNSGKPATASLASATISRTSVGTTASWIDTSFSSAPTLTNGTKYWIVLDYGSNSGTNYWNWRKDNTDAYAGNTGMYTSNCCSGNPTWTGVSGDLAFQVWIGGVNNQINGVTVGNGSSGTATANLFVNTTVHGSSCPNQYCIIDSAPQIPLPLSSGVIQDWKDQATAGGTCVSPTCSSGNLTINSTTKTLGPLKVTGNLSISNGGKLIMSGTIWVQGTISISNNATVELDPGYGSASGVLLTDSTISVGNNAIFNGSGTAGSYIMLLSAKNDPTHTVIDVSNNADGVIFYATGGIISFSNNASANEATGYGISLSENTSVNYESGLANLNFTAGPTGGWVISDWKEVQ